MGRTACTGVKRIQSQSFSVVQTISDLELRDNQAVNLRVVRQADVESHTITLPVVYGKGIIFTRLSIAEGPSRTKVGQIVQDGQGFMWFGTQYGLNRYDGYNYKLFVHDPRNPNSLSGVEVNALFKDRDGALWVGCDRFLNKFNRANETWITFSTGGKDD